MASPKMYLALFAILAVFVPSILATEHWVGDETGWTPNFDYQTWVRGKIFYVGDTLVFKYKPGAHSVLRVNGTGFQNCKAPAETEALTSGNDVIPLTTSGKKWYICGVAKHCESGNQKLAITVLPQLGSPASSPSPSPNPSGGGGSGTSPSGATDNIASRYCGMIVPIVGILGIIVF